MAWSTANCRSTEVFLLGFFHSFEVPNWLYRNWFAFQEEVVHKIVYHFKCNEWTTHMSESISWRAADTNVRVCLIFITLRLRIWWNECTYQNMSLPPATKLGQSYIFTGVCDSVHRGAVTPPPDQVHPPGTRYNIPPGPGTPPGPGIPQYSLGPGTLPLAPGTPPRTRYTPLEPGTPPRTW